MHRGALLVGVLLLAGCATRTDPGPTTAPTSHVTTEATVRTIAYGDHPSQVLDLSLPSGDGPHPVMVLLHGGFWQQQYGRDLMAPLAADAGADGFATANVEYRRVGGDGGWPATFADVATAVDHLAEVDAPLDLDRVTIVGHSAGGHLAVWAGSRPNVPAGRVGADPVVVPCAVVSQAGVVSLARAARGSVGGGAVRALMGGGPDEVPERYAVGDPSALAPPPVPTLLVHAEGDRLVPSRQSVDYAGVADDPRVELRTIDGDHFTVLDSGDESWTTTKEWVGRRCGLP